MNHGPKRPTQFYLKHFQSIIFYEKLFFFNFYKSLRVHYRLSFDKITNLLILVYVGPVTKTENIKTDETKILRPTDFSG